MEAKGIDEFWMRYALRLARKGIGWTSPNPPVGAVIVWDGELIAGGFHEGAGKPHAEIVALEKARERAKGATLYVTLEPCVHHGRTPPCVPRIIAARIQRVVIATLDPNPIVNGRGVQQLKDAGISVTVGILEKEGKDLIAPFAKFITQKIPFVTLKLALTLDGKIATAKGKSKWLTGEKARRYAHRLRHEHDAVLVGVNTVLADNPQLTVRLVPGRVKQPLRVIVDSHARTPLTARVLRSAETPCIIAVTERAPDERIIELQKSGAKVWKLPMTRENRVDLKALLKRLGREGVVSVLVEGGGELAGSFVRGRLVDRIAFFFAPKLLGGRDAVSAIGGKGFSHLGEALKLTEMRWRRLGDDWLLTASVIPK